MTAHKVKATIAEDGTLTLQGLPFRAGAEVEVVVLENPTVVSGSSQDSSGINAYPLQGMVLQYDDPFGSAAPLEDWDTFQLH